MCVYEQGRLITDNMDKVKTQGIVELVCRRADGSIKWVHKTHNLITSAGKAQLALLAGDASATPFTYLAVGSSSTAPAAGNTTLGTELTTNGFARAAATVSRTTTNVTNDTLRLVHTWTASGSATVEEAGVFNASSSGTMLGRALTTTKSFVTGETLTLTYDVVFA